MQTVRQEDRGTLILRLLRDKAGYSGVVIAKSGGRVALMEGQDPNELWRRLEHEAAKTSEEYIGFDGARARFLQEYPQAFTTPQYGKDEREYKDRTKSKLASSVPLEQAIDGTGFGEAALAAFNATNLLSPQFELTRVHAMLRSASADRFIQAAARFTDGEGAPALADMASVAKPHGCDKWTVVTYLPFFWRPDLHMFLKPKVTTDFAARVGHPLAHRYEAKLDIAVYASLLDLVARTEAELADLHPRDRIDVQSFIWVIGN